MPEALDVEGPAGEDEVFENPLGKELDLKEPAAAGPDAAEPEPEPEPEPAADEPLAAQIAVV